MPTSKSLCVWKAFVGTNTTVGTHRLRSYSTSTGNLCGYPSTFREQGVKRCCGIRPKLLESIFSVSRDHPTRLAGCRDTTNACTLIGRPAVLDLPRIDEDVAYKGGQRQTGRKKLQERLVLDLGLGQRQGVGLKKSFAWSSPPNAVQRAFSL